MKFAYEIANNALSCSKNTPLALQLGCGEGKQEGFAIAMRAVWELYPKRYHRVPKLLFLTATTDLIEQMSSSLPFADFDALKIIDASLTTHEASKGGIYLCDFRSYLFFALKTKRGASYSLFKKIDSILVDEFHALLASSPYIMSGDSASLRDSFDSQKESLYAKLTAYQKLLFRVKSLYEDRPNLIAQSKKRGIASFNPLDLTSNKQTIQKSLYDSYSKEHPKELEIMNIGNFYQFVLLLDTMADALAKESAKDYYLYSDGDSITEYVCAQRSTGRPSQKTLFSNRLLATLIALKHVKPLSEYRDMREFSFLANIYSQRTIEQVSPMESMELFGVERFVVASATLGGLSKRLSLLGFKTSLLQQEQRVSLGDASVKVSVGHDSPKKLFLEALKESKLPQQIAVSSVNATLLKEIAKECSGLDYLREYEIECICYAHINPDIDRYERDLHRVKDAIYKRPHRKRLLFIQGLGEGSNIFRVSPSRSYEAAIYKLDADAIDHVAQTRWRVGTRGRAEGSFTHCVSSDIQTASLLSMDDVESLKESSRPEERLLELERSILEESDTQDVAYFENLSECVNRVDRSRRDAFKTIAAATLLGVLQPNEIFNIVNDALDKQVLYGQEASAGYVIISEKEYPPSLQKENCVNKELRYVFNDIIGVNTKKLLNRLSYGLINNPYGKIKPEVWRTDPNVYYLKKLAEYKYKDADTGMRIN